MTPEDRVRAANRIISRPADYKICVGCDSILAARVILCPSCHAYRFERDVDLVRRKAGELANQDQNTVTREDLIE